MMRETNDSEIRPIVDFVRTKISEFPKVALVTGSGLARLAENVNDPVVIPTIDIDGYPRSTVEGHPGKLLFGRIGETPAMVVQGRIHYYEGYPMPEVVIPVRLAAALGCKAMILTTACGGIGDHLEPGDLVRISDHINFTGSNPLIGQSWGFDQFPDMTRAYDPDLGRLLYRVGDELRIKIKDGVFAGESGPSFETPAEIRMLRLMGADLVSMSTVPEVIAAARLRLPVLGIGYISNYASGITGEALSHLEVTEMGLQVGEKFSRLLGALVSVIDADFFPKNK